MHFDLPFEVVVKHVIHWFGFTLSIAVFLLRALAVPQSMSAAQKGCFSCGSADVGYFIVSLPYNPLSCWAGV